ncbi:MAG: mevalonate kinase, partial [Candidatus Nitrosomaritimum yanchengensis]
KNEEEFSDMCKKESELIKQVMIMLKRNDLKGIGKSMHYNQKLLEDIGISNEKLRDIIKIAEEVSFGAKITGAGGGGCIIALTDKSNLEKTMSHLRERNHDCFSAKIDFKGLDTF